MAANVLDRFEFRSVRVNEAEEVAEIEKICFPPHEVCSKKDMFEREEHGLATDEEAFRDEFFTDITVHNPEGKNIFLLGLDVRPEYRRQGLAREIMNQYVKREQANGRKMLKLTCLEQKVEMYKKMGYKDEGISASVWGDEEWHEMSYAF